MKTTVFLLCAAFICTTQQASAKVWRVNNNSNYDGSSKWGSNFGGTQANPVFAEIDQAVSWLSVKDGDTLHVEGASKFYDAATITKRLVIIGPGFFLNENPQTSTNILEAKFAKIYFNSGSEGSQLIGVSSLYGGISDDRIQVNVNDVVVKRCKIERSIWLQTKINNISILENFFTSSSETDCLRTNGISDYIYPTDIYFNNNICKKALIWDGQINQCNNNTFDGPANSLDIQINTGQFQNNILKALNATVNINNNTNNNVTYCISPAGQFGNGTGNITVANINSIFVSSGSSDGLYQIKAGSVADNSGSDGTDRGAYGGAPENSYTLSGLPAIPDIYQIVTTGVAGPSGLPVTIKAKTVK